MAGYEDAPLILRIRERLASDPALSRRAAILAVAGHGSLRRIERKMQREDTDAPFALDDERRRVAALAHAEAYPMRLVKGRNDAIAFAGRQPAEEGGTNEVLAGIVRGAPVGIHGEGVLGHLDSNADVFLLSAYMRGTTNFINAGYGLISLGLLRTPREEVWPHPGGPYHRRLSLALRDAWRSRGLGAHLDEAELLEEACAVEGERLRVAGLGDLLARFPDGFAEALAPFLFFVHEQDDFRYPRTALAEWLVRDAGNVAVALRLGSLGQLIQPGLVPDRIDPDLPVPEIAYRLLRKDSPTASDAMTLDDAAWLVGAFGSLRFFLLDREVCRILVKHREWIEALGEMDEGHRAGLARLVATACEESPYDRGDGLFLTLGRLVPAVGLPGDVWQALCQADGGQGGIGRRLLDLSLDLDALWVSGWVHATLLAQEAIESGWRERECPYGPYWHRPATGEMGVTMTAGLVRIADAMLTDGRDSAGMVALVDAWVSAGRPGHVPGPHRDLRGRLGERAFDDLRFSRPAVAPEAWPALLAFLSEAGGAPRLGETLGLGISALADSYRAAGVRDAAADVEEETPPRPAVWWRRAASRGVGLLLGRAA